MPPFIAGELSATFDLVIRRHEAKSLAGGPDWNSLQDIENRHECARAETEARYRDGYQARLDAARKEIIDERAAQTLDIPTPFRTDRFDKNAITREAERRVNQGHHNDMDAIDVAETAEIEALLRDAEDRKALRGVVRQEFNDSAERRSGRDRRTRQPSY